MPEEGAITQGTQQQAQGAQGVQGTPQTPQGGVSTTTNTGQPQPQTQTPPQDPQAQTQQQQTQAQAYEAFRLPEGMEANPEVMQGAGELFRSMGLNQQQAQQIIDFGIKHQVIGGVAQAQELYERELQRQVDQWGEETKAHSEFGGLRLNESLESVRLAISKLGGSALEKAFAQTGAINHPEVFGAFVRMGKLLREDSFVSGSTSRPAGGMGGDAKSMSTLLYPDMKHG